MTRNDDRPGRQLPGLSEAISTPGADANGVSIVPHAAVDPVTEKLRRLRDRHGYFTRAELGEPAPMFGQPSTYSLSAIELARHVRRLRRSGWQHWEIVTRFDVGRAA